MIFVSYKVLNLASKFYQELLLFLGQIQKTDSDNAKIKTLAKKETAHKLRQKLSGSRFKYAVYVAFQIDILPRITPLPLLRRCHSITLC